MTEGLFCDIYVRPAGLLEREKMKPIFSTEQARYQKFASFCIYALKEFRVLRNAGVSRVATRDKGYAPLTAPPFEKGGRKLSRLGSAVDICVAVILGSAVCVRALSSLAQRLCLLGFCPWFNFFR